jgi:DNA helicase HerA-like ATPase
VNNYIENFIRIVKNKFAADSSNTKYIKLRFGNIEAVLDHQNKIMLNNNRPFFDSSVVKWKRKKGDFYITPKLEANPHIVISGMSGFGKSTLFKSLLLDIRKNNVACIIFDAHDEHSDIVRSLDGSVHNALYSGMNILELDGASVSERISELSRLFKEIYSLGYIQATKLSECLWYTYRKSGARTRLDRNIANTPSIKDLVDELNIFIKNSKGVGERNTLLHLRDRISLLNSPAFNSRSISIDGLNTGLNSFCLANMKSKEAQLIYIGELLKRLYSKMHDNSKQDSLRMYIMIDEAQFLVDEASNNSIIAKLIEEGRKYGVGVIIVTHAASTLNRKIMTNCSTFATFYAREPSEISYVAKVLSGSNPTMIDAVRNKISTLKGNQIILLSNRFRNPVIVSTPKFDEIEVKASDYTKQEIMNLLNTVSKRPIIKEELTKLGINCNSNIIGELIASRFLCKLVLNQNAVNEEWFMIYNRSLSIEHEVWVTKISRLLILTGIKNNIIDNSNGPDISAIINDRKIAIEYETGSKSLNETAKMLISRVANYDDIIIVTKEPLLQHYSDNFKSENIKVISRENIESIIDII